MPRACLAASSSCWRTVAIAMLLTGSIAAKLSMAGRKANPSMWLSNLRASSSAVSSVEVIRSCCSVGTRRAFMTASGRNWPATIGTTVRLAYRGSAKFQIGSGTTDKQIHRWSERHERSGATRCAPGPPALADARRPVRGRNGGLRGSRRSRSAAGQDDDPRAQGHAAVEVLDVLIEQANAARGHELA